MAGEDAVVLLTDVVSSDEDDLQQQEELHKLIKQFPEPRLLEDSEEDTSFYSTATPDEESESESTSQEHLSVGVEPTDTHQTVDVAPNQPIEECDQTPRSTSFKSFGSVQPVAHVLAVETGIASHDPRPPLAPHHHDSPTLSHPHQASPPHIPLHQASPPRIPPQQVFPSQNSLNSAGPEDVVPPNAILPGSNHILLEHNNLQVLYKARGRKIDELNKLIEVLSIDKEREIGEHLEEQGKLTAINKGLQEDLKALEVKLLHMSEENTVLSSELRRQGEVVEQLCTEKKELQQSLHTAEVSVSSLQQQITSLTSSDVIQRVRDQYESNIASLKEQHLAEVLELKKEGEEKDRGELEKVGPKLVKNTSPLPSFLLEGSHLGEDDGYRQIVAENEDLRCLISNLEEERDHARSNVMELRDCLVAQESLTVQLQQEKSVLLAEVGGYQEEIESLNTKLTAIEGVVKTERERYLNERVRFEESQSQSLQFHDQSTARLRNAFEAEKKFISECHQREIEGLKLELASLRKKLEKKDFKVPEAGVGGSHSRRMVGVAVQTIAMETTCDQEDFDRRLKEELERAKDEWRGSLLDTASSSVASALEKAEENFAKRLDREKMAVMDKMRCQLEKERDQKLKRQEELLRRELEEEFRDKLKVLKDEKQRVIESNSDKCQSLKDEYKMKLEKAVLAAREECARQHNRKVEEAVQRARQKWSVLKEAELLKLRKDHQHDLKESVHRAVEKARKHYECVVSDIRNKMAANHQAVQSQVSLEWEREKKEMSDTISTLQDTLSQSQRSKQEILSSVHKLKELLREDLLVWMTKVLEGRQSLQ